MKIRKLPFFADDCSNFASHQHNYFPAYEKQINQISKWLTAKKLTLDLEKTFYLNFGRTKSMKHTFEIYEKLLKTESSIKYLGIFIDSELNFKNHVPYVCKKSMYIGLAVFVPWQV